MALVPSMSDVPAKTTAPAQAAINFLWVGLNGSVRDNRRVRHVG